VRAASPPIRGGRPIPGSKPIPETLKEVDLRGRIRASGASNIKDVGDFFGWEPTRIVKARADFTKEQLLA
jgi:hypothetical protein